MTDDRFLGAHPTWRIVEILPTMNPMLFLRSHMEAFQHAAEILKSGRKHHSLDLVKRFESLSQASLISDWTRHLFARTAFELEKQRIGGSYCEDKF